MPNWVLSVAIFLGLTPDPARELERFPDAAATQAAYDFGAAHIAQLRSRQSLAPHRWAEYHAALEEAGRLQQCWRVLGAARVSRSPSECREDLARLEKLLGARAFALGQMPPPAAFARFREVD